jgi:hypothetical protein
MIIKTPSGILRRTPLMDVIRNLALEMTGYVRAFRKLSAFPGNHLHFARLDDKLAKCK